MRRFAVLVLLLVSCMLWQRINAQTVPGSSANAGSTTNSPGATDAAGADDSLDWLFPVDSLNRSLPSWFRIGNRSRSLPFLRSRRRFQLKWALWNSRL
jgi:hypothetical protein